jgi:hypothetical protein
MNKGPFTPAVWWRYKTNGVTVWSWHTPPRQYRSERAAMMAAKDLNAYYTTKELGNFIQHVALPLGVHPDTVFTDEVEK